MDLREKIAEAIKKHEASPTKAYLILDAVMGVVEEDAAKRRAYTDRRVTIAREAGAHDAEREAHRDMANAAPDEDLALIRDRVGDMTRDLRWDLDTDEEDRVIENLVGCVADVIGAKHGRVRELEKENARLRVLEAASRTIRAERAKKDRKIIEQGRRIRALEDENQRMREALEAAVEFAWTTPKGTVTARYEKVLDPTSDMGPWWLTVPWRPIKGGHIENFHDRDAALSRAREIAKEEA